MIKLRWNGKWIDFEKMEWSGTDNQCSRKISFTIPTNPYDKNFEAISPKLGDIVYVYSDKKSIFTGTITSREKSAEIGTASFTASDFMQHLLRSNGTFKFKNVSPEKATQKVCKELKIETTGLAKTKTNIPKAIFLDKAVYDIIVAVYRKARTGKKYMPTMVGKKVSVIEKGQKSGVALTQGISIIGVTYTDTTDGIVNVVRIYDEKGSFDGKVQNKDSCKKYGIYQKVYEKERGVDAKIAAKALFQGIHKTASVEAPGDVRALSGYSIEIDDKATGLKGTFYISGDTHSFENGVHTMKLDLAWKNTMETGAESEEDSGKVEIKNEAVCFYIDGANTYHSSQNCKSCAGKALIQSNVGQMKQVYIKKGKNKGKRKYKPCSRCWET